MPVLTEARPEIETPEQSVKPVEYLRVKPIVSKAPIKIIPQPTPGKPVPVTIVNVPSTFLADDRNIPSIGELKVAAKLEQANFPVDVLDFAGIANYSEALGTYMDQNPNRQYFGLTATTPQMPAAVKIAHQIKATRPEARVILGGPHATLIHTAYSLEIAEEKNKRLDSGHNILSNEQIKVNGRGSRAYQQSIDLFDVVVVGDGEKAVFEALKPNPPQMIDAGSRISPYFIQRGELDEQPYPARHLIDMDSYKFYVDGLPAHSVITQLGCPFKCEFCGGRDSDALRLARFRSTDNVIGEIEHVVTEYGRKGIMFYDDELNINKNKLDELLEGLITLQTRLNVSLRLRGFVKAELFNDLELAKKMYQAGFRVILSGVESGSDEILKTMRKNTTRQINSDWVRICHEAGLKAKALMSVGHPGERPETLHDTLEWVWTNLQPGDDVDFTIITEYPGAPYFDKSTPHPKKEGVWVYEAANGEKLYSQDVNFAEKADYYKGIPGDYTSNVWTPYLSKKALVQHRDYMESIARSHLKLAPIQAVQPARYHHEPGQPLPDHIFRRSKVTQAI